MLDFFLSQKMHSLYSFTITIIIIVIVMSKNNVVTLQVE